eukprot:jgi/Tetstr1/426489/TSEL_016790.t1
MAKELRKSRGEELFAVAVREVFDAVAELRTDQSTEWTEELKESLMEFADIIAEPTDLPPEREFDFEINLESDEPPKERTYRMSPAELQESFGPLSPASWGQVSSAAAQRAVQIQQAASAEQMSQMVAEMRTIAHDAATAASRAVVQELRQPSLSPKPDPGDTAHHAATSAPAPALVPASMPPPLSPGSLGDDLGALPVAPPRQLGAHDLGRSLKTALSQFSPTDSWPIYRDDFLAPSWALSTSSRWAHARALHQGYKIYHPG